MNDRQMDQFLEGNFTLEEFFKKRDIWRANQPEIYGDKYKHALEAKTSVKADLNGFQDE